MYGARSRTHRWSERWRSLPRWMRAGGVRRRLLMFLVFAVAALAALPYIVAKTPLCNVLLSAAVPNGAVRVSVRDASLSWFSAPSLSGVEVKDPAGNIVMVAERIGIDRSPLALIMSRSNLGLIEVVRPTIHVQVRTDGSNLEDIAQKLLVEFSTPEETEPIAAQPEAPPALAVRVVEGTVHIEDAASQRRWRAERIDMQYASAGASVGLGRGALSGQLVEVAQHIGREVPAGSFSISLQPAEAGREQFNLQAENLALATVEPWLRRFVDGSELRGALSGHAAASWMSGAPFPVGLESTGNVTIDRLEAAAAALDGDRIRLTRVELPWRIKSQPNGLAIEELQLRSEIGQAAVRGRLDPDSAARHDLELRAVVDIARLAAMLPHALSIRADTTITSGTIELAGRVQPSGDAQQITGSVRTAQLAAVSGGRGLSWDQPVNASFAVHRAGGTIQLEALRCNSKFLNVDASGNQEQFSANASFDLDALTEQLGQFVDLSGVKLAGTGTAKVDWQRRADHGFAARATGDLAQLVISLGEAGTWSESQLSLRAEAAGLLDADSHRPARVDTATLHVAGQGDELHATLTAAVALTNDDIVWPLTLQANGGIARWLTRVRPWFAIDPWHVDGSCELTATLRLAANAVEASETKLMATNLRAASPGWNINEARVEIVGDARWNGATNEVSAGSLQLVSSTVSLAARDVRYRGGDAGIAALSGTAAFRADLARLAAWRQPADQSIAYQPKGALTGNVRFAQQGDRITGDITATGQNLSLASLSADPAAQRASASGNYETIWQEPNLTLRGLATYESSADRLSFDQLQIQSDTLQAAVGGQIQKLTSTADVSLNGTLNYDLAQITPLLRPYLGSGIRFTGREQARFAVAGQMLAPNGLAAQSVSFSPQSAIPNPQSTIHWSRRVRAQLQLPWSGANVYGLPIGAGRLAAQVGDGALRIEPLSLTVGEGRLTAAPQVRLDPPPSELALPPGPLITGVRISPEVSEAMLKYVAPVLAGTTQSEGRFSMQLDGTRVPLDQPRQADAAGRLTVHSVRVVPGALAREMISIAQQVEALAKRKDPSALLNRSNVTLLAIRDQQVNFRVVEGRVHHQDMEFQVGDVTLRSQGSVGLDETLELTLQVPIQDAWVAKEPLLGGLKGQSLQIPVSGTLTRPKLDQRAVASLSAQLLQNAAGNAIGNELNKALDKLFKSR